jgi:5-methylcytosine-specific restriction endonuclease McrA
MTAAEAKRRWRQDIKASWGNRCAYCGSETSLTLDHVRPKTRGGRDDIHNLVPACRSCNQAKGSSHWLSWWITLPTFDLGNFSRVISHIAT